jgi:tetratricopeptide (TPR) repeat protein
MWCHLSISILFSILLALPIGGQASQRVYDYYNPSSHPSPRLLGNVEGYHLNPAREGLIEKDYVKAGNNIRFILDYFPNHPVGLALLTQFVLETHKYNFAKEYFNRALTLFPNNASTHGIYGVYLHRQGKLDDAITQYRKAISLQKDYSEAYYNLGLALLDKGKAEEANKAAQTAYTLGYPLPGLRKKLKKQGAWKPLKEPN